MESVPCILCQASKSRLKFVQRDVNLGLSKKLFTLVQCESCGLIYLSPRPTPEEIRAYYPPEYYPLEEPRVRRPIDRFVKRLSSSLKKGIREEFYGYPSDTTHGSAAAWRVLRRCMLAVEYWHLKLAGRDIIPFRGQGRILDVGCGPGGFLCVLQQHGWDAYGVDFSPVAVTYARNKRGLNVCLGELHEARFESAFFDVVLFNHSLEHMYKPVETLQEARRILKPDGLLFITIPNASSWEARLFGKWWAQWDVPRHLYHFTKETMGMLLSRTGFRVSEFRDGKGTTFFLGSVDVVYKHVLATKMKHGPLMKHFLAEPLCYLAGGAGYGGEMKIRAEKVT